jgi:hypothetical protein
MVVRVEAEGIAELEERWEDAVADANDETYSSAETDAATARSLSLLSEIAQLPAANITDVAVKIGIAQRDLRRRASEPVVALLLECAEEDCLRLAAAETMRKVLAFGSRPLALLTAGIVIPSIYLALRALMKFVF